MTLDAVQGRIYTFNLFLCVQALKVAQYIQVTIQDEHLSVHHILTWCVMDAVFLLVARRLISPRIKVLGIILAFIGLVGLNLGVLGLVSEPIPVEYEPELVVDMVNQTHIRGSHTVHVRPPVIVKFNPNSTYYCIKDKPIVAPVLIKGTTPFILSIKRTNLIGEVIQFEKSLTNMDAIKVEDGKFIPDTTITTDTRRVGLYGIELNEPGIYQLNSMKEKGGDDAKILPTPPLVVVTCPTAKFVKGPPLELCIDTPVDLKLEVNGVGPITVFYAEQIGRNEKINVIENTNIFSNSDDKTETVNEFLNKNIDELRMALVPTTAKESISSIIASNDAHIYKIARIVDYLGNSVEFIGGIPVGETAFGSHLTSIDADMVKIEGHLPPTVQFGTCENIKIKTEYDTLHEEAPTVKIPLQLTGRGPFIVDAEFVPENGIEQPIRYTVEKAGELLALEPGVFKLIGVEDSICKGSVQGQNECPIIGVMPPTFSYTTTEIDDSCVGAVGTNLDVSFSGEPPFWIEYRIEKEGRREVKREQFQKSRATLAIRPQTEGRYRYIFDKVGDKNYDGVEIHDMALQQVVHAHSQAEFLFERYSQKNLKCIGDEVELKVQVRGAGPWELSYDMQLGSKTKRFNIKVNKDSPIVKLPMKMDAAGTYIIDLVEITDYNGCKQKLNNKPIIFEVLQNRPSVSFQGAKKVLILEGATAKLPISLSGRGPFRLSYHNLKNPAQILTSEIPRSGRFLDVHGDGVYEIVAMADSVCQGSVHGGQLEVANIPKPTMKLTREGKKSNICTGNQDFFQVDFSGKPPFKCTFNHIYSKDGRVVVEAVTETVETKFLKVPFDTSHPGKHTYVLVSISDGSYTTPFHGQSQEAVEVIVNQVPSAQFVNQEQNVFRCRSAAAINFKLRMKLNGIPPFKAIIEEKSDHQHVRQLDFDISKDQLKTVGDAQYEVEIPYDNSDLMGRHDFILHSLSDSSGCKLEFDKAADAPQTFFEIADQAKIVNLNGPDVCVGDLITFSLQGTPPFSVGYSWNGQPHEVQVQDPVLSLWAGMEGVLQLTKVCNSGGCCDDTLDSDESLRIKIHDLPQAVVGSGDDFIDDIREGDESEFRVELIGSPPFAITYSRVRFSGNKHQEDVYSITDIQGSQWSTATSQEGTFRVTSVKDKFCSFPRRLANMHVANVVLSDE